MHRTFTDRQGRTWEVRERSRSEWELHPSGDNRERFRTVRAPGYEKDPFELSVEELEKLLEGPDIVARTKPPRNPFAD